MAYSKEDIEAFKELLPYPKKEFYRSENAKKVNEKKNPHGYLYLLEIEEFDLYKIGVSQNPKRRIRDIRANNPFYCKLIYCKTFEYVYELESVILELFKENMFKGEWFKSYNNDIVDLINSLKYDYLKSKNLIIENK